MSRPLSRRLSKIEDTMSATRRSIEDLTDAELERAMAVLLARARGSDVTASDAAFYASLKPVLTRSCSKYANLSDDELNVQIRRLIGKSTATQTPN